MHSEQPLISSYGLPREVQGTREERKAAAEVTPEDEDGNLIPPCVLLDHMGDPQLRISEEEQCRHFQSSQVLEPSYYVHLP